MSPAKFHAGLRGNHEHDVERFMRTHRLANGRRSTFCATQFPIPEPSGARSGRCPVRAVHHLQAMLVEQLVMKTMRSSRGEADGRGPARTPDAWEDCIEMPVSAPGFHPAEAPLRSSRPPQRVAQVLDGPTSRSRRMMRRHRVVLNTACDTFRFRRSRAKTGRCRRDINATGRPVPACQFEEETVRTPDLEQVSPELYCAGTA